MAFLRSIYRLLRSPDSGVDQTWRRALEKDPHDLVALEALARHYWQHGANDAAFELASRASSIDPGSQEMLLIVAACAYRLGRFEDAKTFACRAIEAAPRPPDDAIVRTRLFRVLHHLPFLRRPLEELKADVVRATKDRDALLEWANTVARSNPERHM